MKKLGKVMKQMALLKDSLILSKTITKKKR